MYGASDECLNPRHGLKSLIWTGCRLAPLALIVQACTTKAEHPINNVSLVTVDAPVLPAPPGFTLGDESRPYFLGPRDKIEVSVFGEPTLSASSIQVGGEGSIFLPFIGEMSVQGLTTTEVSQRVTERLRMVLQAPQVSVNMLEGLSQTALVDGAVAQPGAQPIIGRKTLQETVAAAGGPTEHAIKSRVLILRTVDNRTYAAFYDIGRIRNGIYEDPEVFPGDKIYVGETQIRRILRDVLSLLPFVYLIDRF